MEILILLRHGKAVREHEAPTDRARGLTKRGLTDAAAAGEHLQALGLKPDVALVSDAARAQATYAGLSATIGAPRSRSLAGLYMAEPAEIWRAAWAAEAANVLVVGHNPGLHELASILLRQSFDRSRAARELEDGLPTAAFAAFSVRGELLDAASPFFLGGWRPRRSD